MPATRGRRLLDIRLWVGAAIAASMLLRLGDAAGASALWFLDPLLLLGFLVALRRRGHGSDVSRAAPAIQAAAVFIGIGWLVGMLYELSISTAGSATLGGMHPKTIPSFLLAQGFYLPFAGFGYLMVRRTDVSLRTLFFAAGSVSVFEMLMSGTIVGSLASPWFLLTPLIVAYYVSVYALFVCWPVVIFGEGWFTPAWPRHVSGSRAVGWMLLAGAGCWVIFAAWGAFLSFLAPALMKR